MIYFVQEVGLFRNRVKIGFTNDIKRRLDQLRVTSPSELKVLLTLPGDMQTEAAYHERFSKYRLHGEWFKFGPKLRLFIWSNFGALSPHENDETEAESHEPQSPEKIQLEIKHIENGFLREENIDLPAGITYEQFTEWAQTILMGTKTPALSHWTGSGKPFTRNNYTEFVCAMIKAGILISLPGKGNQLTSDGEYALNRLLKRIKYPPTPKKDVCNV